MTALARANLDNLRGMLEKAAPKLNQVAPKHLSVERMTRLLLSACSRNPKILECSPESVLQFAMKCSETGLEPIGAGGAWSIPYENRKNGTVELQFIPDYRGLVNCAKRAGCIKDAYAEVVRKNDEFDYELGLEPKLTHRPARGDRGDLENAYCVIVFPDDTKRFVVMDKAEVEGIRQRSRASSSGPWVSDPGEMWKKTVVRRAMKPFAGASQELDAAIEADNLATGLVDVTPKAAVPMPKAIEEPAEDQLPGVEPSEEAAPEPTQAPAEPTEAQAEPAEVDVDPSWQQSLEVVATAIKAPTKKGQPWRIDTQEHGVFKTWDEQTAKHAEQVGAGGFTATYWFEEKPARDPKYPADMILRRVVPNS